MKDHRRFPIIGLISTGLIVILYLIYFFTIEIGLPSLATAILKSLAIPLVFAVILYALLTTFNSNPDLSTFKLIIGLLIVIRCTSAIIYALIILKAIEPNIMTYPVIFLGVIFIGVFLWFMIAILKIKKGTLIGQNYLNLYALFSLLFIAIYWIPDSGIITNVLSDRDISNWLFVTNVIPYIFIALYFYQVLTQNSNRSATSA